MKHLQWFILQKKLVWKVIPSKNVTVKIIWNHCIIIPSFSASLQCLPWWGHAQSIFNFLIFIWSSHTCITLYIYKIEQLNTAIIFIFQLLIFIFSILSRYISISISQQILQDMFYIHFGNFIINHNICQSLPTTSSTYT